MKEAPIDDVDLFGATCKFCLKQILSRACSDILARQDIKRRHWIERPNIKDNVYDGFAPNARDNTKGLDMTSEATTDRPCPGADGDDSLAPGPIPTTDLQAFNQDACWAEACILQAFNDAPEVKDVYSEKVAIALTIRMHGERRFAHTPLAMQKIEAKLRQAFPKYGLTFAYAFEEPSGCAPEGDSCTPQK